MAVTATATRTFSSSTGKTLRDFGTISLTGTYVTGGFALNPLAIAAGPGSLPAPSRTVLDFRIISPTGYIYALSGTTVKIFSAPGTELANTTAVPDASVSFIAEFKKLA